MTGALKSAHKSVVSMAAADLAPAERQHLQQAVAFAMAVESGESALPADLSVVDPVRFNRAVARHRLEICLGPHLEALNLPVEVIEVVRTRAVGSRMSAMAVAAVSIEVSTLLANVGVRTLIFKGCALAAQSTGDFTARGAGDVDVLVHPDDVEAAVVAFEGVGFSRGPYVAAKDFDSRQWRYARWLSCELPLTRGRDKIDLHWALTNVRSALPAFDDLWRRREYVEVSDRLIPTLGLADALAHSCAHSLKDQWRWIRSLVDVDRLARRLPVGGRQQLSGSLAVHLTASVALETTSSRHLAPLVTKRTDDATWARRTAGRAQLAHLMDSWDRWTPARAWRSQRQQARLASTPGDWTCHIVGYLMPPSAFNDPVTGEGLRVSAASARRVRRVVARLAGAPGKDPTNGQRHQERSAGSADELPAVSSPISRSGAD